MFKLFPEINGQKKCYGTPPSQKLFGMNVISHLYNWTSGRDAGNSKIYEFWEKSMNRGIISNTKNTDFLYYKTEIFIDFR